MYPKGGNFSFCQRTLTRTLFGDCGRIPEHPEETPTHRHRGVRTCKLHTDCDPKPGIEPGDPGAVKQRSGSPLCLHAGPLVAHFSSGDWNHQTGMTSGRLEVGARAQWLTLQHTAGLSVRNEALRPSPTFQRGSLSDAQSEDRRLVQVSTYTQKTGGGIVAFGGKLR